MRWKKQNLLNHGRAGNYEEEKRVLELDKTEEGVIITALNEMRNDRIEKQKSTDIVDELLLKIFEAPSRKVRMRDDAR